MILRLALLLSALFAFAAPARADDISAAARGVVRVVTIAVVDDEVVGFGHGSGFAVAPNRIVTNAHVVEAAARYPGNVIIGVVPSEGSKSYQGRLVAYDPDRDLALIEFGGVRLPPLTLLSGAADEGASVVALGYPGNVDLATARSSADFIRPLSPVRSQGNISGRRTLTGTDVLLHTASIARGNSGGPLLDRCGRVIGVNSAITRSDEGDASFFFAIGDTELTAFLAAAKQPYASVDTPCTTLEERAAQDRSASEQAAAEAARRAEAEALRAETERTAAIEKAREANLVARENFMAAAALLLVLGAMTFGAGALLEMQRRRREAIWVASGGGVLMLAAIALFLLRPGFNPAEVKAGTRALVPAATAALPRGKLMCTLVPERSRAIFSNTRQVTLDIGEDGCINGRTQYAEAGKLWERILVPSEEQTVSVLAYDPATRTYTNSRYLLSASQMTAARNLRSEVKLKACSVDPAARADLASKQSAIKMALPRDPNEKLVYNCTSAGR